MKTSKYELDMTQGSIFKNVLRFAIPYMLTSMLQIFYNSADLVVVSRWTGSSAMASVGATSALTTLLINLFLGMSVGSSVIVSRHYGAHNIERLKSAVHTSVLFGVIVGIISSLLGLLLCKPLLICMDTPDGSVLDGAVLYMRIIFLGTPATLIYSFSSAILRSVGDTKRPLYILSISGLANIGLNLVFVIKFGMGVAGVALATIISKYISAVWVLVILIFANGDYKVCIKDLRINPRELKDILHIGVPAGLQNTVLSISNTLIQSAVNSFGVAAMAGSSAAHNIESFVFGIKDAFRQATVTAISQNYGAQNKKRMDKSFRVCISSMLVVGIFITLIITLFAKPLLSIYITDSAEAMKYGVMRMMVTGIPYFLSGIMDMYIGYLRGLGHSGRSTVNSFIGICGFRILWVLVVFPQYRNFAFLYLCWPLSWILTTVLNAITLHSVKKDLKFE